MHKNYYKIDDPSDRRDIDDQVMADWIETNNPKVHLWTLTPEQPDPNTVWQNGAWVTPPEPVYTAEQWLDVQGFQDKRSTVCLYLKLQLDAANKTSPKLAAVQAWMDGIIAQGILNPDETKSDWLPTPHTFPEATTEALQTLQA